MKPRLSPPPDPTIVDVPDPVFEPGDRVRVEGSRSAFVFRARRRNLHTGEEWLDLVSRQPNDRVGSAATMRSFRPELVKSDTRKALRKTS